MKNNNGHHNGFRYGAHRLEVLREFADLAYNGKKYKIVMVKTEENENYISIKQYNDDGEFLKQLLIEPEIAGKIGRELCTLYLRSEHK